MSRHLLLAVWLAATAGCAGYRLGPTNGVSAGSRTVQVALFENLTDQPRLTEPVATALRRQLQQDGTYRLVTSGSADLVVTGTLTVYERDAVSYQPDDIITARDFRVVLAAAVMVLERDTGRTNLQRVVTGRTTVRVGSDQASAERQAAPLLAEDLARNITSAIVDGSW